MNFKLEKIFSDRGNCFGYVENDKYFGILRDRGSSALYRRADGQKLRTFKEAKYVTAMRFYTDEQLLLKTIRGKFFLYDIPTDRFVWQYQLPKAGDRQEYSTQLLANGSILMVDFRLPSDDICCLARIDPQTSQCEYFTYPHLQRFTKLIPAAEQNQFFLCDTRKQIHHLDAATMQTTQFYTAPNDMQLTAFDGRNTIILNQLIDFTDQHSICDFHHLDLTTGEQRFILRDHADRTNWRSPFLYEILLIPNTHYAILHYLHCGIRVFDLNTWQIVYENLPLDLPGNPLSCIHISNQNRILLFVDNKIYQLILPD